MGDLESSEGGFNTIADHASVANVIQTIHRTNSMQAIVTGGFKQGVVSK